MALRCFKAHGQTPEALILHQTAEGFNAQAACSDVLLAVDTTPQPFLGIVEVEHGETLQANEIVKLGKRACIPLGGTQIIASGKGMLGVETKPQAVAIVDQIEDLAHVRKAMAQTRALPGG